MTPESAKRSDLCTVLRPRKDLLAPGGILLPEVEFAPATQLMGHADVRAIPDVADAQARVVCEIEDPTTHSAVLELQRPRALAHNRHPVVARTGGRHQDLAAFVDKERAASLSTEECLARVDGGGECCGTVRGNHRTLGCRVVHHPFDDWPPPPVHEPHMERRRPTRDPCVASRPYSRSDRGYYEPSHDEDSSSGNKPPASSAMKRASPFSRQNACPSSLTKNVDIGPWPRLSSNRTATSL